MTSCRLEFIKYQSFKKFIDINVANDEFMKIIEIENIMLKFILFNEKIHNVLLSDVLHASNLNCEFIFIEQFTKHDVRIIFYEKKCMIVCKKNNKLILHFSMCKNQYLVNIVKNKKRYIVNSIDFYSIMKINDDAIALWHRRVDHLNRQNLIRLIDMSKKINFEIVSKHENSLCDFCKQSKMRKKFSRKFQNFVLQKNECIDFDFCEFIDFMTMNDYSYFALLTCKDTRRIKLILFRHKNDFFDFVKNEFMLMIKTQTLKFSIKRWRIDENDEIFNKRFKKFFAKHNIKWKSSTSYVKKQNEMIERQKFIIMNNVKVILIDVDLSHNIWDEIFKTIIYLKNRAFVSRLRLQNKHITFYKIYENKKFDINHYRIIECDVWLTISKNVKNQKKFNDRAIKCKLLSYRDINQYRLYNFVFKRVITIKDVVFDEFTMLDRKSRAFYWDDDQKYFKIENFDSFENDIELNDFTFSKKNDDDDDDSINEITLLKICIKMLLIKKSKNNNSNEKSSRVNTIDRSKKINNVDVDVRCRAKSKLINYTRISKCKTKYNDLNLF